MSGAHVDFASLAVGDALPSLPLQPEYMDLVVYAGTSRDYFIIHHDRDAARAARLPDVIIQGSLKAGWLGRVVTGPLGEQGVLRELGVQYRGVDVPDRAVTARGVLRAREDGPGETVLSFDLWLENDEGARTVVGSAVVALPARTAGS